MCGVAVGAKGEIFQRKDGSCYYLIEDMDGSPYVAVFEYNKNDNGLFSIEYSSAVQYDTFIGKRKKRLHRYHHGMRLSLERLRLLENIGDCDE